jgi:asparagine synthase (glutamine-hydrolysing)
MEGEVFNSAELVNELANSGLAHEPANDAELMLHLYTAEGVNLFRKVNGCFVVGVWDARDQSLTLVNDRMGVHYLYYFLGANRLVFAPEMKAILCDPTIKKTVDASAVGDFFSFGCVLGNKSFVSDIMLMPPGSIIRYKDNRLSIQTYWDFPFQEDHSKRHTRDYVEELHQILDRVIERQTGRVSRCGIALSGGLDSRIVAAYVSRRLNSVSSFTFGDPTTDEAKLAERVARIVGSQHNPVRYSLEDFTDAFQKMVWLNEGLINTSEHYHLGKALGRQVDAAFCGTGGDEISGRLLSKAICRAKDLEVVKRIIFSSYSRRVLPEDDLGELFSAGYSKIHNGQARANFEASFSTIRTRVPANFYQHHYMRTKLWREHSRVNDMARLYVRYRYPYFDYELIDFFLKLPPEMRLHEKVYRGVLIHKFPKLADLPLPVRRVSVKREQHLRAYYVLRNRIGGFVLRNFYEALNRIAPPEAEIGYNVEAYRGPLKALVRSLVLEGNRNRGYFNQVYLERLVADHFERRANNAFRIHKLIAFELFHRLFLDVGELAQPVGGLL